ncbi:MAG: glycosyltransferase family 4 protein [Flavobacteriales bacterium]|nr:glycosyltransferase family 4 protein [Flavobacteriales bacterium]
MRILQICHKPPYPAHDGGCLAMAAITEGLLANGHTVKVLCMATHAHPFLEEEIPKRVLTATRMEAVNVDVRVKLLPALWNLLTARSYNLARFVSRSFDARLVEILKAEQFDIIHIESLFCAHYIGTIREHTDAKVVLRAHNVEYMIWKRLAGHTHNPLKHAYLLLLADRLRKEEPALLRRMDGIITITGEDGRALKGMGVDVPMETVPMGLRVAAVIPQPPADGPLALYHLASMDWQPNLDAVDFFLRKVWPGLHALLPDVSVHFAGRHMPHRFMARHAPPLYVTGEVPSATVFARDRQVMVVPLHSGGGMRIKIVEAMALGKVVLSTTIGAEGIPYTEGNDLLIADTAQQFIEKLKWLNGNPKEILRIGTNARHFAEQHFDLPNVTERLVGFYGQI